MYVHGDVKGKIINGNQYHNFSIKDFCLKFEQMQKILLSLFEKRDEKLPVVYLYHLNLN